MKLIQSNKKYGATDSKLFSCNYNHCQFFHLSLSKFLFSFLVFNTLNLHLCYEMCLSGGLSINFHPQGIVFWLHCRHFQFSLSAISHFLKVVTRTNYPFLFILCFRKFYCICNSCAIFFKFLRTHWRVIFFALLCSLYSTGSYAAANDKQNRRELVQLANLMLKKRTRFIVNTRRNGRHVKE